MKPLTTNWRSTLIILAMAILFLVLAIAEVMASPEIALAGDSPTPWAIHLRHVDEALAQKNVSAARHAWRDAYAAALWSRRWEGLVEVGDACLRMSEAMGDPKASEATARRIYLGALFLARQQGSLDGVLGVAEAFARLGDSEVVEQSLRMAERIAAQARDAEMAHRVAEARKRLALLARP